MEFLRRLRYRQHRYPGAQRLIGVSVLMILCALAIGSNGLAAASRLQATFTNIQYLGGATGAGDARDTDTSPVVAYDAVTNRYLVVWMTARRASSSTSGLDVYGVFLNQQGTPAGTEFRISDNNSAARNGSPTVVATNGGFVVAWTEWTTPCRILGQRVTDTTARTDLVLVASTAGHNHSPDLVYNPQRQRYVLTFVNGDDYLPPSQFGAETASCGNNAASTSQINAMEFSFSGDTPVPSATSVVSDGSGGAFRPRLAYSVALGQYLAIWEDRRSANVEPYTFDVYTQRLDATLTKLDINHAVNVGTDYTNSDTTTTWTPRPVVTAGADSFLLVWFKRQVQDDTVIWSSNGQLIRSDGTAADPFTVAEMPFVAEHAGKAPTGFLAATYMDTANEYLIGMTAHIESLLGYFSPALIQRVSAAGQLLKLDGTAQDEIGIGSTVDLDVDDHFGVALAPNAISGNKLADYLIVYSKHPSDRISQDFDIWGARLPIPAPNMEQAYLPLMRR